MTFSLPEIRHNQAGFEALVHINGETKDCFFDNITIDMGMTTWFDADMCAGFGALLYRLGGDLNTQIAG